MRGDDTFLRLKARLLGLGFKPNTWKNVYELHLQRRIISTSLWAPEGWPYALSSLNLTTWFATVDELDLAVIYQVLREEHRDRTVTKVYLRRVLYPISLLKSKTL